MILALSKRPGATGVYSEDQVLPVYIVVVCCAQQYVVLPHAMMILVGRKVHGGPLPSGDSDFMLSYIAVM